ncbi:hypothetical protein [uncultured Jatrophihabitans sp.]|uniref:hypothetical protein n=1 Tax=uncultured Jatrophihabitans sp. TaxID=1610747 RepID=UPI0035CA0B8F
MSTTTAHTTANPAAERVDLDVDACACHLYDAECALHAAHQSGVDAWITAATNELHQAVADYLHAVAERSAHPQATAR